MKSAHFAVSLAACALIGASLGLHAADVEARRRAYCASGSHGDPCTSWADWLVPPRRVYCDEVMASPYACFPRENYTMK